jgi:phosphatidate cytidylyltransferase
LNEFTKRLLVVILGVPVVIAIIFYSYYIFIGAVLIISSIIFIEYSKIIKIKGGQPHVVLNIITNALLIILISYSFTQYGSLVWIFVPIILILYLLIIFTFQVFSSVPNPFFSISSQMFGILYITLSFCTMIAIRLNANTQWGGLDHVNSMFQTQSKGESWWAYFLICVFVSIWLCDILAYIGGKTIGKHKLLPRVSPKKTWEGAIFGLIGGAAGFIATAQILIPELPLIHSVIIGLIIPISGQIGDLAESLLKRDAGIKDSSEILPGHGGMLDRFDSILFVTPLVYIYLIAYEMILFFGF